jgi:hypothetical protein
MTKMGESAGRFWPSDLIHTVIGDLARDNLIKPVEIQLVATALYLWRIDTLDAYKKVGGLGNLLRDYLAAVFDTLPQPTRLVRRIVRALVMSGDNPRRLLLTADKVADSLELKRDRVKELIGSALASIPISKHYAVKDKRAEVGEVLEQLEERHIVEQRGELAPHRVELVHDVLAEPAHQAATPQEIGIGLLRSALAQPRPRLLSMSDLWDVMRCTLDELPQSQRGRARAFMALSAAWLAGKAAAAVLILATAIFTAAYAF